VRGGFDRPVPLTTAGKYVLLLFYTRLLFLDIVNKGLSAPGLAPDGASAGKPADGKNDAK
jgi:hypothetical protein